MLALGLTKSLICMFQEYLDMGRVKKVDLYENGTIAIVEAVSPELGNRVQRVRVQLPGTSQVCFLLMVLICLWYRGYACPKDELLRSCSLRVEGHLACLLLNKYARSEKLPGGLFWCSGAPDQIP